MNDKKLSLLSSVLTISTLKAGSRNLENIKKDDTNNTVYKLEESIEQQSEDEDSPLDLLNQLATLSKSTEEIYVTGDLKIGKDEDINPGIYSLEITGGLGNIFGERAAVSSLLINWVGVAKNFGNYPSKIRILLFEGDVLKLDNISKIRFNAIPEKAEPSNELGIGEFIVGRDIPPGDYKLSTDAILNPEYGNLGWSTKIYNYNAGQSREQKLTATNNDVAVSLKDGEVISISYDNTDYDSSSDDVKLIFSEF